MSYRNPLLLAYCALALAALSPLRAQTPAARTEKLITRVRADRFAGRFAEALALLQAPPVGASPADKQDLQIQIACVQNDWGMSFLPADPAQALPHLQAALAIDRAVRSWHAADDFESIATSYEYLGQHDKAANIYQKGIAFCRQHRDEQWEAELLERLGCTWGETKQYDKGTDALRQAAAIYHRRPGLQALEGKELFLLGGVYSDAGQYRRAIDLRQQALPLLRHDTLGSTPYDEAATFELMGDDSLKLGEYDKAVGFYQQALALQKRDGDELGQTLAFNAIETARKHGKKP